MFYSPPKHLHSILALILKKDVSSPHICSLVDCLKGLDSAQLSSLQLLFEQIKIRVNQSALLNQKTLTNFHIEGLTFTNGLEGWREQEYQFTHLIIRPNGQFSFMERRTQHHYYFSIAPVTGNIVALWQKGYAICPAGVDVHDALTRALEPLGFTVEAK